MTCDEIIVGKNAFRAPNMPTRTVVLRHKVDLLLESRLIALRATMALWPSYMRLCGRKSLHVHFDSPTYAIQNKVSALNF
jgi:hypothetical protein